MNYCKNCIIPETRPDQFLDKHGICNACKSYEEREKIDWKNRLELLKNIIEEKKK